jgi:hypothetical protein
MRRLICIPLVMASLLVAGLVAPLGVLAAPRKEAAEVVTFISRDELIKAGLIVPATAAPSAGRTVKKQAAKAQAALCLWDCIYVTNKKYLRTLKPFVTMVQGNGPANIAIDISRTVANSFSASVGVSAQVVSAGVGFNVQRSETVAYRSSTTVPSGACWSIRAYNVFYEYGFEIWEEPFIGSDRKIGSGNARDFRGIEFRLSKFC